MIKKVILVEKMNGSDIARLGCTFRRKTRTIGAEAKIGIIFFFKKNGPTIELHIVWTKFY